MSRYTLAALAHSEMKETIYSGRAISKLLLSS